MPILCTKVGYGTLRKAFPALPKKPPPYRPIRKVVPWCSVGTQINPSSPMLERVCGFLTDLQKKGVLVPWWFRAQKVAQ